MACASVAALVLASLVAAASADIHFSSLPFAFTNLEKHAAVASHSAIVGAGQALKPNALGVANKMAGGFQLLTRSSYPGTPGGLINASGLPVMKYGPGNTMGVVPESSVNPDMITVFPRAGNPAKADLFVHFEAPNPGSIYRIELDVAADGTLAIARYEPVDFSAWGGVWTPCAGSVSPWGTHLGSEEYEPDARAFYASNTPSSRVRDYARYFGLYAGSFNSSAAFMTAVRAVFNPYKYGHVTEVYYDAVAGKSVAKKLYGLGRVAIEMPLVMPDNKTVYVTDDGRDVGFFKYVADVPGDLSKGRLYAAKMNQTSAANDGVFTVSWIDLGATEAAVLQAAVEGLTFNDIFDIVAPVNRTCASGYKAIKHSYGEECLILKPGKEMLAAAFETRRYAAYLGATTEWTKWEGITFDSRRNRLYTAMTEMVSGCLPEPTRFGGIDDLRIPANPCGAVYAMDVDASYSAINMYALTSGTSAYGTTTGIITNNTCHIEKVSSPDNVHYDAATDLMLITEDTDWHENNFLWSLDLPTGELTRLVASPIGSEVTGSGVFRLNGFLYIFAAFQHPLDSSIYSGLLAMNGSTGQGGYIGYFGPFKNPGPGESIGLQHIEAPTEVWPKVGTTSSGRVVIGKRYPTSFLTFSRSGDVHGDTVFGANLNARGQFVSAYNDDWSVNISQVSVSNAPDYASFSVVCDKTFVTAQFEWQNPAAMYTSTMIPAANGSFSTASITPVDWSAWGGLWIPCAGSNTPWGTRMGSEEYEPDARLFETATSLTQIGQSANPATFSYFGGNSLAMGRNFDLYYGNMTLEQLKAAVKPYMYGYVTEVKVQYDGSHVAQKHYTLGRVAVELGYVMPDRRTVYTTDDGTNVGFFKFVADVESDLSRGHLYCAKVRQESAVGGGKFRMEWIWLGYGDQALLLAAAPVTVFSDIFETAVPSAGTCPEGFRSTNQGGMGCECLKLKPGMEMLAAFFETRRYAAYVGGTTEFSKWEGITFDAKRNKLYTAMSDVRFGMEDFKARGANSSTYDICGSNDIRLQYNRCGCVYALPVDAQYNAYYMEELVCGTPTPAGTPGWVPGNNCHMDRIASPDNVAMINEHDTLLIGEDTSEHQNDVMWSFDLTTRALTRIFSTPYGAETTGAYWYPDVNGFGYIMSAVQHPYGESDAARVNDPESYGLAGATGVIGPFPSGRNGGFELKKPDCRKLMTWVSSVSVSYTRAVGAAATVDAYVHARIENILMRLSKSTAARTVTTKARAPVPAGEGLQKVTIAAKVLFGTEKLAADFSANMKKAGSPLYLELQKMAAGLAATTPLGGLAVATSPARYTTKSAAYTP